MKHLEEIVEKKINQELHHLQQEIDSKVEQRLKQILHNFANQEKRIDKVASSILSAVDQKFIKDCELKQQIFYKMDERMDVFDSELLKKSNELSNLIATKISNTKSEFNEICQEIKRSWKAMIDEVNTSNQSNNKL